MAILHKPNFNGAHWYTPDGKPAHRIAKKDGDGDRQTTIRDAVRLGLYPSVTSMLGILAKPQLDTWKQRQVALAALRTPKTPEEAEEYWADRVISEAFDQVDRAADLGTRIHAALESGMNGEPYDEELRPYVAPVLAWKEEKRLRFIERELVLVNKKEGFAGCADVFFAYNHTGIGILDYKTRKTKPGEKVLPYDGQGMQLAAYAATYFGEANLSRVLAANVFISTTEPGRFEVVKNENLVEEYEAFKNVCRLWQHLRGYRPQDSHVAELPLETTLKAG